MRAYDETYLERARTTLGCFFDYGVNDLGFDLDEYAGLFVDSGLASRFGSGDPSIVAGRSGVELAWMAVEQTSVPIEGRGRGASGRRDVEYWTGWAVAYYQWHRALSFEALFRDVPASTVAALFEPYHQMDILQFVDGMDELVFSARTDCRLKARRRQVGLTQRELSEAAGVPLRTLQQYEQRQKNINSASVYYVVSLAKALYCEPMDLMEPDWREASCS